MCYCSMNTESLFTQRIGGALSSAFGGNSVPGPISQLVNRLGDNLVGSGYGHIAQTLPNYTPNADGTGMYFGMPDQQSLGNYWGVYRAQDYLNPMAINIGHHGDTQGQPHLAQQQFYGNTTGVQPQVMVIG